MNRFPRRAASPLMRLALLFLLALLASPALEGARADAAQVTVVSVGGARQTIALEAMAGREDITAKAYVLRSASGEGSQEVTGFSLTSVLDAANADPYSFSYLEIQRPAGGVVMLSRDQALEGDGFPDGKPAVYATATATGFLRPSSGSADLNATDSFEAPQGITVVLRKGEPLQVKAKASKVRVEPGQTIDFSAVIERSGAGQALSYSWYFDDGNRKSGQEVSHKFTKRGSFDVVVGVTRGPGDSGASAIVTVQVGEPVGGPDRKGGGKNKTEDAPDHGAAEGPAEGSGSGIGTDSGASGYDEPAPVEAPEPAAAEEEQPRPEPEPEGEEVSGELLSAPVETPTPPSEQAAARTGHLDENGGGGLSTAAWGMLATLGLFGAGALLEAGALARLLPSRGRPA